MLPLMTRLVFSGACHLDRLGSLIAKEFVLAAKAVTRRLRSANKRTQLEPCYTQSNPVCGQPKPWTTTRTHCMAMLHGLLNWLGIVDVVFAKTNPIFVATLSPLFEACRS